MTRPHDMKHLAQLRPVALGDVEHLLMKEKTYRGSWKRSGGRSAWFMLRRKIDRLLEMMKRPEPPHGWSMDDYLEAIETARCGDGDVTVDASVAGYLAASYSAENIFAMIRSDPSGTDGSVLAEVRDLRRYLLLVEAEMVSRGAIEDPQLGDGSCDDLYSSVAHATGAEREDVKAILLAAAYSGQTSFNATTGQPKPVERKFGVPTERTVPRYNFPDGPTQEFTAKEAALRSQFEAEGKRGGTFTGRLSPAEEVFGGLEPWLITKELFLGAPDGESDRELLDQLYDDHGAGLAKLVPCLEEPLHFKVSVYSKQNTSPSSTLMRKALACYVPLSNAKMHVLDLTRAPRDYRSAWPRLHREYNAKELGDCERWARDLYEWVESETKYRIKPGFEYWTVRE